MIAGDFLRAFSHNVEGEGIASLPTFSTLPRIGYDAPAGSGEKEVSNGGSGLGCGTLAACAT